MLDGTLYPGVLLKEPFEQPYDPGEGPYGRDIYTAADGGGASGAPWNFDWRGETFVADTFQGYGGPEAEFFSISQPTSWDSYNGLVQSQPIIHGYAGTELQETTLAELRAGQTIAFPTSGQMDPGFDPVLITLPFEQGMDVGWQNWLQQGRRMLFEQPLDYSAQTQAIPAAGWP